MQGMDDLKSKRNTDCGLLAKLLEKNLYKKCSLRATLNTHTIAKSKSRGLDHENSNIH